VQRPFSADFCAAIAAISRVQRAFALNGTCDEVDSPPPVQISFIALLKLPFKSSDDDRRVGWGQKEAYGAAKADRGINRGVHDGTV
jgi:hypothetical protein